ncbi:MAG: right-handed parallel beta-helix repeat-containing protein [Desulfobacteraceae bacterium]|nr:right-handed parallel beta-helix repeat-containing protein [Desulfobacteraceae bacterium]
MKNTIFLRTSQHSVVGKNLIKKQTMGKQRLISILCCMIILSFLLSEPVNAQLTDIPLVERESSASKIIYVRHDATGANDGSSWEDARTNLQTALTNASNGDEVWVASGTYKPTADSDRSATFQLKNGVEIYGGFDGLEDKRDQRDWQTQTTILSGDIQDNNNSYHVVTANGADSTTVIDGFTITKGYAESSSGGGMYADDGEPTVINCIFINNTSDMDGGGMYNNGSPTLINCSFINNTSDSGGGGGMYNNGSPSLINCSFINNTSDDDGGGMYNNGSPSLINCSFINNCSARDSGGGLSITGGSPILDGCIFTDNSSYSHGGGVHMNISNTVVTDCTFRNNEITDDNSFGAGMAVYGGTARIVNSTFDSNYAYRDNNGGGLGIVNSDSEIISCTFFNNNADYGGGIYIKGGNSSVIHCTLTGNTAYYGGQGIYNTGSSNLTLINTIISDNIYSSSFSDVYNDGGIINSNYNIVKFPSRLSPWRK